MSSLVRYTVVSLWGEPSSLGSSKTKNSDGNFFSAIGQREKKGVEGACRLGCLRQTKARVPVLEKWLILVVGAVVRQLGEVPIEMEPAGSYSQESAEVADRAQHLVQADPPRWLVGGTEMLPQAFKHRAVLAIHRQRCVPRFSRAPSRETRPTVEDRELDKVKSFAHVGFGSSQILQQHRLGREFAQAFGVEVVQL